MRQDRPDHQIPRVCLRQIRRNKKDDPLITWRIIFLSQKIRGDLCDDNFRHPGRRPVKGYGLPEAAGLYQRIELFVMPRLFAYSVYSSYH